MDISFRTLAVLSFTLTRAFAFAQASHTILLNGKIVDADGAGGLETRVPIPEW